MLWDVQIGLRTKLVAYMLLGINVVSCVGSIIRLRSVIDIGQKSSGLGFDLFYVEAEETT